jgi:hypothetical protein
MNRNLHFIKLGCGTAALLIAVIFMHLYSLFVNGQIELNAENSIITPACESLRDYSLWLLILPFGALVLGIIAIASERPLTAAIICELAWLLTLGLICFTILSWQISLIPAF